MRHRPYVDLDTFVGANVNDFKAKIRQQMKDSWGDNWQNDPEALADFEDAYGFLPNQAAKVIMLFAEFLVTERIDPRYSKDEEL